MMDIDMDPEAHNESEDPGQTGPGTAAASPGTQADVPVPQLGLQEPINFSRLKEEIQSIPYFTWVGALTTICLGVFPTIFDMASDFSFATPDNLNANTSWISPFVAQFLTYLFISLPGILQTFTFLQQLVKRKFCSATCCQGGCCRLLGHCLAFVLMAGVITGLVFMVGAIGSGSREAAVPPSHHPLFYSALLTAISIVGVKVLAVFLHSPEMKRLVVRITALESQNEAALQLLLVTMLWLAADGEVTAITILSGITSILTIGKAGAENLLTFGRVNRLQDTPILEKLKMLALFSPVFILTSLFRIGSLAVIFTTNSPFGGVFALPVLLVLPLISLLTLKCCSQLADLSFGQLVEGVMGELTCLCLWGDRGRQGSRNIQLAMAMFSLVAHTIVLAMVIAEVDFGIEPSRFTALGQNTAVFCLCSGWISFPLFIFQIFRMKD